jgi:hypothetical protein
MERQIMSQISLNKRPLFISLLMFALVLGAYFMFQETTRPRIVPPVLNPGFESELSVWVSAGSLDSSAHSGNFALTHGAGKLETSQTLTDVPNGWRHPESKS